MAEKKSFVLRITPELWDALQASAEEDFRSANGQIEFILTDYLRRRGRLSKRDDPAESD
jgi:hypothetical protein